jgi:hypothetical protein
VEQRAGQTETEGIFAPHQSIERETGQLHRTVAVDFIERDDTQSDDVG